MARKPKSVSRETSVVYGRLYHYLKPYRVRFFYALLAMTVFGLTDGAVPFLIRKILDDIFGAQNKQMLWWVLVFLTGLALVRGVFGFLQQYLANTVGIDLVRDIRNDIHKHLLSLSTSFFTRTPSGSLISSMTNDTLLVRTALTEAVASLLRDTIRMIALLAAALYLDPFLGSFAFLLFPLCVIPVIKFGKNVRSLSRVGQDQFGGLTSALQETIQGHRVVQGFGMETKEQERFEEENEHFSRTLRKAAKYGALSTPVNEIIGSMAVAGVVVYGGLSVISGVRTQGDFIAFITALFLLYEPLKKLGRVNSFIQTGVAAADRIFDILDTKPEIVDTPGATELVITEPRIEFVDVSFSYPSRKDSSVTNGAIISAGEVDEDLPALNRINLIIEPGTTLALVGMSGGGKSTLVNLLPRFYDPQLGVVKISGVDIRDVTLSSLRHSIASVSQHTFLFNDSVLSNIRYGRFGASDEEIIAAAKAANAHDFIMRLPAGYETVVGEQGFSLSGGERARLAIARALLRDSPILILDEATASLDSESERLVQEAIERAMVGRTVLVIAHRLATVLKSDKIAVVVRGRVVELGTHQALMEKNGEYAKLYRIQFQGQRDMLAEGVGAKSAYAGVVS